MEKKTLQLNLSDKVIFAGFRKDIPEIMAALDIFVLPTCYEEGFCRSILEAMASSKPVVTTPLGGNPELVINGLTGLLVPSKNPLELSEAIRILINDKEKRKNMGMAGKSRIEKLFTAEPNIRKTEEIYEKLLY